ncbi:MAG: hypothetical protein M8357_16025 [Desulfobulbaceae bacterium]|nr:hypothetical protein [Desulfobulbaceae bacterium]
MKGFADLLYRPIQVLAATESVVWPSFITAFLTYVGLVMLVEWARRRRAGFTTEWNDRRQPPFWDHEALLQGKRKEKEQDLLHPRESSADRNTPAAKTDSRD